MNSEDVWNEELDPLAFGGQGEKYYQAVLEQYKLFVEMADRVSARRSLTNTFFLALNSAIIAAVVSVIPKLSISWPWLMLATVTLIVECALWFTIVRSYRLLNSAKFTIINMMEARLPASPWSAEWKSLGPGSGVGRYWRLTLLERWVPAFFVALYVAGALALIMR